MSYGNEAQRIKDAGGWIKGNRVCGVLNLARSFGDIEYKNLKESSWDRKFSADLLIAEPETKTVTLGPDAEFLILASDGLYDVMTSQEAVNEVREQLHVSGGDVEAAARHLLKAALKNSMDNVSITVVSLNHQ